MRFILHTIYRFPRDHPERFVVRRSFVENGVVFAEVKCYLAADLEDARQEIPEGAFNLGRQREDDEAIFETWIERPKPAWSPGQASPL